MVNARIPKGFSLTELMLVIAVIGIIMTVAPTMVNKMFQFYELQQARSKVDAHARASLDIINRLLRQATASTVVVTNYPGPPTQPPYSWLQFSITLGTGAAVGNYGFYQYNTNLMYMHKGTTSTLATDLQYIAFSYPETDNSGIVSVSMTFQETTYMGRSKALQLSIEKVRVMN